MTRKLVYGMGGKVDLKKLKRDLLSDIKKLKNRKKYLMKHNKFTGTRKKFYNERMKELKKHL